MDNVNLLRDTLKPHLKWHGVRLSFLELFLIALFRVKKVNLADTRYSRPAYYLRHNLLHILNLNLIANLDLHVEYMHSPEHGIYHPEKRCSSLAEA